MKKTLNLKNESGASLELVTNDDNSAKLFFLGDIASENWQSEYYEEDKCPNDIKDFLSELKGDEKLDIYINSCGGSVFGGIAIYNMLKRHKGKKTVYVEGVAASIASVIAMAGDKIVIPSNAFLMIHKPLVGVLFNANADDLRKEAETLDVCQKSIMNIYSTKLANGASLEEIEKMVNAETWLTGDEAKKFFDVEVTESIEAVACATNYNFKNAPDVLKKCKIKDEKNEKKFDINDYKTSIEELVEKHFARLKAEEERTSLEARKKAILADLELI